MLTLLPLVLFNLLQLKLLCMHLALQNKVSQVGGVLATGHLQEREADSTDGVPGNTAAGPPKKTCRLQYVALRPLGCVFVGTVNSRFQLAEFGFLVRDLG